MVPPATRAIIVRPETLSHALFLRVLSGSVSEILFATSAVEALTLMLKWRCDVAIVSLNLPDLDGLELLRRIFKRSLARCVVVLQDRSDPCTSFLLPRLPIHTIVDPLRSDEQSLHEICRGLLHQPETTRRVETSAEPNAQAEIFSRLTEREFELFTLLGGGHSVSEAAARLGISEGTVQTHRHRISFKLRLKSRQDLVWKALLSGAVRMTAAGQVLPGLSCLRLDRPGHRTG